MTLYPVIQVAVGSVSGSLYAVTQDGGIWYTANANASPVVWVEITPPPAKPEPFV